MTRETKDKCITHNNQPSSNMPSTAALSAILRPAGKQTAVSPTDVPALADLLDSPASSAEQLVPYQAVPYAPCITHHLTAALPVLEAGDHHSKEVCPSLPPPSVSPRPIAPRASAA